MDTSFLQVVAHRPWPPPRQSWRMAMVWHDLLFAHWPVALADLRRLIPVPLEIDAFDGNGWLGIVPFHMTGVRHRLMPAAPWLSVFPEINVRTYVRHGNRPGVWFFSLGPRAGGLGSAGDVFAAVPSCGNAGRVGR